jgi:hypothetical protein
MADHTSPKGFWGSLADGIAEKRKEHERKKKETTENIFRTLGAFAVLSGDLPKDIDKALGPEGKIQLANSLLESDSRKKERERLREEERKARQPIPLEEQYRREAEREAQQHFGKKAAYQAEGQRRIAEFLKERSAGLSGEQIKREIENINDWVQRKIDEL